MATLTASFLADLDELSDHEGTPLWIDEDDGESSTLINYYHVDDLDGVSKLQKSHWYISTMQKVEDALSCDHKSKLSDPEYDALMMECNALSIEIENEIFIIHNFIRDKYRLKFPELESLVNHPIDYARVVKKIGNAMDMTLVDLEGLLPSAIIMVVSVTASTTSGKPLPPDVLHKTLEACDRALSIESAKKKILDFVESRMGFIAPNLSAVVGSAVAAKLIASAGGLSSLAFIPSDNIRLLGAKRNSNNVAGFSRAKFHHVGGCYIEQTDIIQSTPPSLRKQAYRMLADKSILAARTDYARGHPTGQYGKSLRGVILKKIEKLQELPPAKQPKPLPVPGDFNKKKRGGERKRKMNKRYEITERQKRADRMEFGVAEESSLGDGLGQGFGMLGQAVRIGKLHLSVAKKKFKSSSTSTNTRASSGLTSSLAFTPVQGIELPNPDQAKHASQSCSTYFSETAAFSKIKTT